jgi:eukaryotic-like serine/threonine-protein kinase
VRLELRDQIQSTLGDAFRVERELGGGGMSRVFVATDAALGRRLVVKVLPPDALAHVSVERFKREIRLAARLQHPHIVPLLAAGDMDGLPYYTMPFVQGESLRERLTKHGSLPVGETVHVLRDVASALAYAHGEGVVHRDIKPDNIILSGGVAVVADFGVAKALVAAERGQPGDIPRDPADAGLTSLGIALGTPAYMSPEQAAADPHIDHRADIYSFGCVAYEMLTGASPFAGRPPAQMLAAHVQVEPDPIMTRRPQVPAALGALVTACLAKRPDERPQSAAVLLARLDAIAPGEGSSRRRSRLTLATSAVVVIAFGAFWMLRDGHPTPARAGRVSSLAATQALEMDPAISPDGKFVAYVAGAPGSYHIRVKQVAGERSADVSAELPGEHRSPQWSPDGSQVAFLANGAAYAVPSTGGAPRLLVESHGSPIGSIAWSSDGARIAYADGTGLWVRPAGQGESRRLATGGSLHSITWSPDGSRIAYVDGIPPLLENLSAAPINVVDVATAAIVPITKANEVNLSPAWAPDGRSLFYTSARQGTLDIYQQFLTRDGQPRDSAQRITTGLSARRISLSSDGTRLAYDVVRNRSNIWSIRLATSGVASMASASQVTSDNQRIEGLSVSHDGQWLAYDSDRSGNADIYRIRIDGGEAVQITTDRGSDFAPAWSGDDRRLLFYSSRTGSRELYSIGIDGSDEQQLTQANADLYGPQVSPDGSRLFAFLGPGGPGRANERYDVAFDRDASGRYTNMRRVTPAGMSASRFRLSWDGAWLGYITLAASTPPGLGETVRAMTPDGRADHAVLDLRPHERPAFVTFGQDPKTMFIITRHDDRHYSIYSVPVAGGTPRLLLRDDPAHRISRWDFATDGRRLFVTLAADESDVYMMELRR